MTNYHFIGIAGIGMSGLANILLDRGCSVSGSDLRPNNLTKKKIKKANASIVRTIE